MCMERNRLDALRLTCKRCRLRLQSERIGRRLLPAAARCTSTSAGGGAKLRRQPPTRLSHTAAMSSDLIQRLQRLQRGFSWPCASEADAEALLADAAALYRLTDHNELSEPAAVSR